MSKLFFNVYGLELNYQTVKFLFNETIEFASLSKWDDEYIEDHIQYQINLKILSEAKVVKLKNWIVRNEVEAITVHP